MLLFLLSFFPSCNDNNLGKKLNPEIEIEEELTVGPSEGRYVIPLKSTYPWYADTPISWIKLIRKQGQYNKPDSIVFEVLENPDMEKRETDIEVRLMDQMSTKIHITQNGRGSLITFSRNNIIFAKGGGELTIDVSTQLEWEIATENIEGITATKVDDSHLKIVVGENTTGSELTRELTVQSTDKTVEAKLIIVQYNVDNILAISLTDEDKDVLIEKTAKEFEIPVSLNIAYQYAVSDNWITVTEAPVFEGDVVQNINIKVSVSANSEFEERYGYVCLKNSDESVTDTFHISQMASSQRIYVKAGNVGGDGTSWETAYGTFEEGTAAATHYGDQEIWVAKGEYQLSNWLEIKKIKYYGGFDGTENKLKDRNMKNKSTLIAAPTNTWPSVYGYAATSDCLIDGFIFTGSKGTQGEGALVMYAGWIFRNNIVTGNNSTRDAGGTYSSCVVYNCLFYGNRTLNNSSTVNAPAGTKIYNCTIVNNTSEGGASSSGLRLGNKSEAYNCVIWNNRNSSGSNNNGYMDDSTTKLIHCAVEGGLTFNQTPSSTEGSISINSNNAAADGPNFVSVENNDYSLNSTSLLIDKGFEWTGFGLESDIIGNTRKWGSTVDIGAYEYVNKN